METQLKLIILKGRKDMFPPLLNHFCLLTYVLIQTLISFILF